MGITQKERKMSTNTGQSVANGYDYLTGKYFPKCIEELKKYIRDKIGDSTVIELIGGGELKQVSLSGLTEEQCDLMDAFQCPEGFPPGYFRDSDIAKKIFDSFGRTFTLDEARQDVHLLIDRIFRDRGSCDTCRHLKYGEFQGVDGIAYCPKLNPDILPGYCGMYEPKGE